LAAQTYVWTGELPTGFQGQPTVPNDGSANLYFGDSLNPYVALGASLNDVHSIVLANGNNYTFKSASSISLAVTSAISVADEQSGTATFNSNINIDLSGTVAIALAESSIYVRGQITGTGSLLLTGGPVGSGALILSNTGGGNTYSGNTTIGDGSNLATVAFWNSSPFGTGSVTLLNGGFLIAHGTDTVANDLVLDTVGTSNPVDLKSWDTAVTYTGTVTLDNNVTLSPKLSDSFLAAPLNNGSIVMPGPWHRNPIILSGNISESGGSRSVTVQGPGILAFTGTNSYTGGTTIGSGALILGPGSIPATGSITVNALGYLGTTDTSSAFSTLLAHVSAASNGSFGVDSLSGTATYSNPINLSTLSNAGVEIGTATSAILTGAITPQSSAAFQFGGGGGTLYVDTPLANGVATNFVLNNYGSYAPLTVYLQGTNTYIGTTTAEDGFLIFDGANSLPGSTTLTAYGTGSDVGNSYIGYTDALGITPATFLGYFAGNISHTFGIIGFDAHTPGATVTISGPIDLTGFNNGVFIGTSTKAILSGALTPSTVVNTYQTSNTLRFTAVNSGVLTVDTTITDNGSPLKVELGVPNVGGNYSSGTVIMNAPNTYSGGTTLNGSEQNGLTLGIGNNAALGTGTLTIDNNGQGGVVGLEATAGAVVLPNAVTFLDSGNAGSTQLNLVGSNNFALSGNITGDSSALIELYNSTPISVALTGNNAGFAGTFDIFNGTLQFPTNTSAGNGGATLSFQGSAATADFTGSSSPVIEAIQGQVGNLVLGSGTNLRIDTTEQLSNQSSGFGGVISGAGALTVTNSSSTYYAPVILYGDNTFSGGTTVAQNGLLVMGNSQAAGSGGLTVATTPAGALVLNSGVTYSGPLTFTSGNLAGYGTFDPDAAGLSGTVTIGPNQGVVPGFPSGNNVVVTGTLSFAGNMDFNNGGTFLWSLQDNSRADGMSQLSVAGNLDINATAGGFTLELFSFDASGTQNNAANFNVFAPYSWVIATTGGTIQNFNAADFVISTTSFENGLIPASHFALAVNGADNQLILNFTPVPEPSTYVLVAVGLGILGLATFRRCRT
jgi:autotransporter-associated beta strand protein